MAKIGGNLSKSLRGLTELFIEMKEGQEKDTVKGQILQLTDMIDRLVDENLPERIEEYKEATKALSNANKEIGKAKADIAKVATAIDTTAKAISAITKLLAALCLL